MIGRIDPYAESWREGRLRIATYNIHRSRGMDGLTRPQRIADVLRATEADVIALQEVIGPGNGHGGHVEALGAALGMGWVMSPTRELRGHQFGNVILSRFPIRHHTQHDLTWRACEPRLCQRADLSIGKFTLQLFNVHLGTAHLERRYQARHLATYLQSLPDRVPKVVLGDFNEWLKGETTRLLSDTMKSVDLSRFLKRRRTYPGLLPVLHLDHIYYDGPLDIVSIELPRTRLALVASDHLPLIAEVQFL